MFARGGLLVLAGLILAAACPRPLPAADAGADAKDVQAVLDKAVEYLKKHQSADGSFSVKFTGPGVTALVVAGMLRNGYTADDPMVAKAIGFLEKSVKAD